MPLGSKDRPGLGGPGHAPTHARSGDRGRARDIAGPPPEYDAGAVGRSFAILAATVAVQAAVVGASGSLAVLAYAVHGVGGTAVALAPWLAARSFGQRPKAGFTHGLGRTEDLAGLSAALFVLAGAIAVGVGAVDRLMDPRQVVGPFAVAAAGVVGLVGRVAAPTAGPRRTAVEGIVGLVVLLGAAGVGLGLPWADPLAGLLVAIATLGLASRSGWALLVRALDGVDVGVLAGIRDAAGHVPGVRAVTGVRARWLGRGLDVEVTIAVGRDLGVAEANGIAVAVRGELHGRLPATGTVSVLFDAAGAVPVPADRLHPRRVSTVVHVDSPLARGTLAIVATPEGDRMRLATSAHADDMSIVVRIDREGGRLEQLFLLPLPDEPNAFQSVLAPAGPRSFRATLELMTGDGPVDAVTFSMRPGGQAPAPDGRA